MIFPYTMMQETGVNLHGGKFRRDGGMDADSSRLRPHLKIFLIVLGNSHSEPMAVGGILSAIFVHLSIYARLNCDAFLYEYEKNTCHIP